MELHTGGRVYHYQEGCAGDPTLLEGFNLLAQMVFGYRFEALGSQHHPHMLLHKGQVVANVSASLLPFRFMGRERVYVQLGTVMTHPAYRGEGLSRYLLQQTLSRWQDRCDGLFLFAGDSVHSFYTRFGFLPIKEYQCTRPAPAPAGFPVRRLSMDSPADRALVLERYRLSNPFSALAVKDCPDLLLHYLSSFLREHIYYLEDSGAVIIARHQGSTLLCYEIFSPRGNSLDELLAPLVHKETATVTFGFSLLAHLPCSRQLLRENGTALYVLGGKEDPITGKSLMFPLLCRT